MGKKTKPKRKRVVLEGMEYQEYLIVWLICIFTCVYSSHFSRVLCVEGHFLSFLSKELDFPGGSDGNISPCRAGDQLIPGSGRSPGEGNGNPLQCSCLENPMDRGACQTTVHGVTRVGRDLATKTPPYIYKDIVW